MGGSGGGTTTSITDIPQEFKPAFTQLFNSAFGAARTAAGQPGFGTQGTPGGATSVANNITGFGGTGNPFAPPGSPFSNPFQSAFPQPSQNIFAGPTSVPGGPGQSQIPGQEGGAKGSSAPVGAFGAPTGSLSTDSGAPSPLASGGSKGAEQQQGQQAAQPQPSQDIAAQPNANTTGQEFQRPPDPATDFLQTTSPDVAATPDPFGNTAQIQQQQGGQPQGGAKGSPGFNESLGVNSKFSSLFGFGAAPQTGPNSLFPQSLEEGITGLNSRGKPSTQIPLAAGPPIVSPAFGEQFTAGTSPFEFESLAQKEAIARQLEGIGNPLLNLGNFTAQGGFLDPSSNPFLQKNIEASLRPISREFANSTVPNFNSQAISSGAFQGSSARDLAFNQLASGFGQQLLDTGTGIAFDNFQRERVLQQNAGQLLDQGALLNQLSPELLAQVGLGQRELAQRPLDEALLQFQESINAPFRALFPLASIIQGGDIGSAFSTTVPGPSQLSSGIVGALGGAGAGAGIFDLLGGDSGGSGGELSALLGALAGGTAGAVG